MDQTENAVPTESRTPKITWLGIAALLVPLTGMLCFCLFAGIQAYFSYSGPRPMGSVDFAYNISGFSLIIAVVLCLIGAVLAVVSLFQKRAGKAFGIISLVLAVLVLCSTCGVYAWAFLIAK
jgi:uncharacterized membrane protein YagU involved in acid resistance